VRQVCGRWCAVTAAVLVAACAATAHAAGSFAITLSQCGTPDGGFAFTINGAGADPNQPLEVDITSSEAGAFVNPNFLLPAGVSDPDVQTAAVINPDGTFTFAFGAGSAQLLPATIVVYTFDTETNTHGATPVYTTTVTKSTACTDGSSLGGSTGGGGGGGGGALPTAKWQCLATLWKTFGVFKNQGDCVSFVATRGKNPPARLP
jgi:hypothetical protein